MPYVLAQEIPGRPEAVPEQASEREAPYRKREVATRGPSGGRKARPNCSAAHEVGAKGSH
mgnify:CR=1 FL=1